MTKSFPVKDLQRFNPQKWGFLVRVIRCSHPHPTAACSPLPTVSAGQSILDGRLRQFEFALRYAASPDIERLRQALSSVPRRRTIQHCHTGTPAGDIANVDMAGIGCST